MSRKENAMPDWVEATPAQMYTLICNSHTGEDIQYIDLTHDEFVELKSCLATLRGYLPAKDWGFILSSRNVRAREMQEFLDRLS